jgi:hypothetical protein
VRRDETGAEIGCEDRAWVEEVASALSPASMNADRARAFRLAIDARTARRGRARGARALRTSGAFALAATAGLAFGIWLGRPAPETALPVVVAEAAPAAAPASVRSAWIDADDDEQATLPAESLPGDYLALASFVVGE